MKINKTGLLSKISVVFFAAVLTSVFSCSSCTKDNEKDSLTGTHYFLDSQNGDDSNDGLSTETPWKTYKNLKTLKLQAGDHIYFKRGSVFTGRLNLTGKGTKNNRIVIDAYGEGAKPSLQGTGLEQYAVKIYNSDYMTIQNLEIVNHATTEVPGLTGLWVEIKDFGVSHDMHINGLTVRDVNGSRYKGNDAGCAVRIINGGEKKMSIYNGLRIENCHILRCERNGLIWWGYPDRNHWFPNINTVVSHNLIEEVPGDGIVPIGCDGVTIEYNIMRNSPDVLPDNQYAAGIWPWSCDNVVIQFNEVSGHKAPGDGQGLDCDDNCNNTIIRYNYSHENWGGFVLICENGAEDREKNIGCENSEVYYNLSVGDGIRPHPGHGDMSAPLIQFAGPAGNTKIFRNILHVNVKPAPEIDRTLIRAGSLNGAPHDSSIYENLFFVPETTRFRMDDHERTSFDSNIYLGNFTNMPTDDGARFSSEFYKENVLDIDPEGYKAFDKILDKIEVCGVEGRFVNKEKMEKFFNELMQSK